MNFKIFIAFLLCSFSFTDVQAISKFSNFRNRNFKMTYNVEVTSSGGTSTFAGYNTLSAAITAINGGVIHTGTIVCNVQAGYSEVAPSTGYILTASGSNYASITFQKNGSGANPVLTAFSWASGNFDGIFKISGSDNVIIDGFDFRENSSGSTEYAIGLFPASSSNGSQNNVIKNCNINLSNSGSISPNSVGIFSTSASSYTNSTSVSAANFSGTNSNNKIISNNISGVAFGVYFICMPITSTVNETGNEIGGNNVSDGNVINFGSSTSSTLSWNRFSASSIAGIVYRNGGTFNIKNNSVTSQPLSYPQSNFGGIIISNGSTVPTVAFTPNISNNNINITNLSTNSFSGIDFAYGNSSANLIASSNNIVMNQTISAASTSTLNGIRASFTANNNTVTNNIVSILQSTSSGINSGVVNGINVAGIATNISVLGNTVKMDQNSTGGGSYTGGISFINAVAGASNINISQNILTNSSASVITTGTIYGINHNASFSGSLVIDSNQMNISKTSSSGSIMGIYSPASTPISIASYNITNNNINFQNIAGTSSATGIFNTDSVKTGSPVPIPYKNISQNIISISGSCTGNIYGLNINYSTGKLSDNSIALNTTSANMFGINSGANNDNILVDGNSLDLQTNSTTSGAFIIGILSSSVGSSTISNNKFNRIQNLSTILNFYIYGIEITGGQSTIANNTIQNFKIASTDNSSFQNIYGIGLMSNHVKSVIYGNKISDFYRINNNSNTNGVNGIYIAAGSSEIYNNTIGKLYSDTSYDFYAVNGIYIKYPNPDTYHKIYYNTIYLDATSSGAIFGSQCILHASSNAATESTLDLRNNILINKSVPKGAAKTTCITRTYDWFDNYASTSNNNIFYAGVPGPKNLIFCDYTSNYIQTIDDFKTLVAGRESMSETEDVSQFFISTDGSSTDFLRIQDGSSTLAESRAQNISSPLINTDFWNVSRPFSNPINGGILPDIGASEFDGKIICTQSIYKNSGWTYGEPGLVRDGIFEANYDTASANVKMCSCQINNGISLKISPNSSAYIRKNINNDGELTIESDGNLIQEDENGTYTGNSAIVKRNANMKRLDYTFWGSPVDVQQLKAFSPSTVSSRFYEYRETDDKFYTVDWNTNFVPAKGYAIRAPSNYTSSLTAKDWLFTGKLNNGQKNFTLKKSSTGSGFNLISNPYPSNINFDELYNQNSSKIYQTAYFWTNNNVTPTTQLGSGYTQDNYAVYSGTGGIPATYTKAADGTPAKIPSNIIRTGQGFIVKSQAADGVDETLEFHNSIRTTDASSGYFFNKNMPKDRFWLTLTSPSNIVNTILIGYVEGASDNFDKNFDAEHLVIASDSFYSILEGKKLGIQGKLFPLKLEDKISLGVQLYETGNYIIALSQKEGTFVNGQDVFLNDKLLGTQVNLQNTSYTFQSSKGEFLDRFEIVYKPSSIMSSSENAKNNVEVYRDGENFVIKSSEKIGRVEVYEVSGKLLQNLTSDNNEITLDSSILPNRAVYILKINTLKDTITRKIIK